MKCNIIICCRFFLVQEPQPTRILLEEVAVGRDPQDDGLLAVVQEGAGDHLGPFAGADLRRDELEAEPGLGRRQRRREGRLEEEGRAGQREGGLPGRYVPWRLID